MGCSALLSASHSSPFIMSLHYLPIADVACPPICIVDSVTITNLSPLLLNSLHIFLTVPGRTTKEIHIVPSAIDRNNITWPFRSRIDSSLLYPEIPSWNFLLINSFILNLKVSKLSLIAPSITDVSALCNAINKWTFADRPIKIILFKTNID